MLGAPFTDDPIFNGLAISLIFGILVSTLLTPVVIPVLYFLVMQKARAREFAQRGGCSTGSGNIVPSPEVHRS